MKAIALDVEVYEDWSSKVSTNLSENGKNEKVDLNSTWCMEPPDIKEVSFRSGGWVNLGINRITDAVTRKLDFDRLLIRKETD